MLRRRSKLIVLPIALALGGACAAVREPLYDFYDAYTGAFNAGMRTLGGVCEAPDAPCDTMPEGVERVFARGSYIYLIPVGHGDDGGVVLIDTGFERDGASLTEALQGRKVKAALITHAHPDHTEAAHLLDAPVYVGRPDVALWKNEALPRAAFAAAAQRLVGLAPVPKDLRPVDNGDVIDIEGARFEALLIPGHTSGSVAWVYRDMVFTGDAVTNPTGAALIPTPGFTTDDMEGAWRQFGPIADREVGVILDGHYGRTDYAVAALEDALAEHRAYRASFRAVDSW